MRRYPVSRHQCKGIIRCTKDHITDAETFTWTKMYTILITDNDSIVHKKIFKCTDVYTKLLSGKIGTAKPLEFDVFYIEKGDMTTETVNL